MDAGVWAPTNVWKMYVASNDPNRHYYRGPGNEVDYDGLSEFFGYASGYGIGGILDTAWQDLLSDRALGDARADIIGFSRGGVEAIEFANRVAKAFPDEQIRFVGLYDPVGSVGLPGFFMGYASDLPPTVEHGVEAVAANENRSVFPWTDVGGASQTWFRGVHADIGGGWADHRLSDVVLQWMMGQAEAAGVSLDLNKTLAQQYNGQHITFTPNPNAPINANEGVTSWLTLVGTLDRGVGMFFNSDWVHVGIPDQGLGLSDAFTDEMAFSLAAFGVV